jgi:hypothetical protein
MHEQTVSRTRVVDFGAKARPAPYAERPEAEGPAGPTTLGYENSRGEAPDRGCRRSFQVGGDVPLHRARGLPPVGEDLRVESKRVPGGRTVD